MMPEKHLNITGQAFWRKAIRGISRGWWAHIQYAEKGWVYAARCW